MMRRIGLSLFVFSVVVTLGPATAWADDGDWYAESGVLFVTRDLEDGETVVTVNGAGVFETDDDLEFDFEPGAYGKVGKQLDDVTAIETGVMWVGFSENDGVAGPNNLDVFPQQPGINQLDDAVLVRVEYESDLLSLEANVTRELRDGVDAYGGFRYIYLDETLDIQGTDNNATSAYNIDTVNHLLGGHLGVQCSQQVNDRLYVGGRVGGGIFANLAEQDQTVGDLPSLGLVIRDVDDDETAFAWLVEAMATVRVQVTETAHVRGGYGLMYIDGVALAPDQFDVSAIVAGTGVDSDGDALYHGGFFGVGVIF